MIVYQTMNGGDVVYLPTLEAAHAVARGQRGDIYQWDAPTDKVGVLRILNAGPFPVTGWTMQRRWTITQRGGLAETALDSDAAAGLAVARSIVRGMLDVTAAEPADEPALDPRAPALVPWTAEERQAHDDWKRRNEWRGSDAARAKAASCSPA